MVSWGQVVREGMRRGRAAGVGAFVAAVTVTAAGCASAAEDRPASPVVPAQVVTLEPAVAAPALKVTEAGESIPTLEDTWSLAEELVAPMAFSPRWMDMAPGTLPDEAVENWVGMLGEDAREDWDTALAAYRSGDGSAEQTVTGVVMTGLSKNGYRVNQRVPITNYKISGEVSSAVKGEATTRQKVTATVHLLDSDGKAFRSDVSKNIELRFTWTAVGGGDVVVEGWKATTQATPLTPEG